MESSRKGKEREKTVKMRLVPPRIAAQWRSSPSLDLELGDLENVIYTSIGDLKKVRRKLDIHGESPVYGRLTQASTPKSNTNAPTQGAPEDGDDREDEVQLDGWLVAWEIMPEGCCVVAGPARDGWSDWTSVR
jgi:hypothetical protein